MDLSNIKDLKVAMQLAGIKANKGLGQHFLIDAESVDAIIEAADITPKDTVLEVGPGLGVMTDQLAKTGAQVVAVETDATLAELLRRRLPDNVRVEEADIMKFNLAQLPADYKVVANVPYYITSPIIRLLMESKNPPTHSVLLIQKEVAERIAAKPGQMSILALSVQYYADVELVVDVPRDRFYPIPNVDSTVIKLVRKNQPAFEADTTKLFRLIKAGFGEKRKQMRNSLSGGLHITTEQAAHLIAAAGLVETARAQELSLDQWKQLYDVVLREGYLG
jgi:16S rRNA (adenine1518-N6/adenine1519-N6)-dimethyltransferase